MKLTSPEFKNETAIPSKYTCDGENINPPLEISDVPKNAKCLVLRCDDPDASAGVWLHWIVWNIDPRTKNIAESSVPKGGVQGVTSFGSNHYGGPCPPSGEHRYLFKIYAMKEKLDLTTDSTLTEVEKAMEDKILAEADLMCLYNRGE